MNEAWQDRLRIASLLTEAKWGEMIADAGSHNRILTADIYASSGRPELVAGAIDVHAYQPRSNPFANRYPYIRNLNVDPGFQHRGIGMLLLDRALATFSSDLKVATYIFEENHKTFGVAQSLGFTSHRINRQGNLAGGDRHLTEHHMVAPNVAMVRENIAPILGRFGLSVI